MPNKQNLMSRRLPLSTCLFHNLGMENYRHVLAPLCTFLRHIAHTATALSQTSQLGKCMLSGMSCPLVKLNLADTPCTERHRMKSSLHHKCRRLVQCSEKARSSSGHKTCTMLHWILLFPPGTCPRRMPCRMLQRLVLQPPRTCPRRRSCRMLQRFVL